MSNSPLEKEERYPLEGSTDLIESLVPIFDLLGAYNPDRHSNPMDFLSAMGRPAIEEIIRRFRQIIDFGCNGKLDYFKMPQTRTQDHYKKGERLWYIRDIEMEGENSKWRDGIVKKVDSWAIDEAFSRYDLHVFFENGDRIPLRSIGILSQKEIQRIFDNSLISILEKVLPATELEALYSLRKSINTWTMPQKKDEVKNLVSVLLQRQDQAKLFPKNREDGHYVPGDFVWYYDNDLHDRDMRGAEDSEFEYKLGVVSEIIKPGDSQDARGMFQATMVVVDGQADIPLRCNKIFKSSEIVLIDENDLYESLERTSEFTDKIHCSNLKSNVYEWKKKASELGIGLKEYLMVHEEGYKMQSRKIRI